MNKTKENRDVENLGELQELLSDANGSRFHVARVNQETEKVNSRNGSGKFLQHLNSAVLKFLFEIVECMELDCFFM